MKKVTSAIIVIFALLLGITIGKYYQAPISDSNESKKALYWIDPMEPQIHYPGPGMSRMNMKLVPVYAENKNKIESPNTVSISSTLINNLGVRTSEVKKDTLTRTIETVGYVEANENKISHIHTYTEGWIKKLNVKTTGENVKKGQLLFKLYSPSLVSAQQEYILALETANLQLITASRRKLETLMISNKQIEDIKKTRKANQLIDVFSPQDGFVDALNIREGMQVRPDMEIMSLVDLSTVWIMAQIYEQQADWVKINQEAYAKLPAFPEKKWPGKVEYIYPTVDSTTRTLKIRFLFMNPELLLKPNMYANISVLVDPKPHALSIPIEALIRSSKGSHVIVSLGEGQFQVRAVTIGIETHEQVEILAGLKEGEKVVTSGQFLIDSEASLKASMQRMESATSVPIVVHGVIEKIDSKNKRITLKHEAISELNMSAMIMDYSVDAKIDLKKYSVGEGINFTLMKDTKSGFIITKIENLRSKRKDQ